MNFENQDTTSQRIALGLGKISTALRHGSWRQAAPRGVTPTQGQILTFLLGHPGATLRQVSDTLGVRPATASEAVSTLEERELLRKDRQPDDGRVLQLRLTREGETLARDAAQWPEFLAEVVDELPAAERAAFLRAILALIRSLQQQGRIPVSRMCVTCRFFRPNVHPGADQPHHCAFVDAPFGDLALRLECPDHEPVAEDAAAALWQAFRRPAAGTEAATTLPSESP